MCSTLMLGSVSAEASESVKVLDAELSSKAVSIAIPRREFKNYNIDIAKYKANKFASARAYFRKCKSSKNETCIRRMSKKQKKAYRTIVKKTKINNPYGEKRVVGYYLTDIDKDGSVELILKTGDCEAVMKYTIYTYKKGRAVRVGYISASHKGISYYPGWNGMITSQIWQGAQHVTLVTLHGTKLREKMLNSVEGKFVDFPYDLDSHSKYMNKHYGYEINYRPLN